MFLAGRLFFCGASTAFGKVYCFLKGCNFSLDSRKEQEKKQLPQGRLLCPLQPVCSRSHNSLQAATSELACMWWRRCSPIRIIFSGRNVELVTLVMINPRDFSGLFSRLNIGIKHWGWSVIGFHSRLVHLEFIKSLKSKHSNPE